jgi:hypothetical protein
MSDLPENPYAAPTGGDSAPASGSGGVQHCYRQAERLVIPCGCEHELPAEVCVKCGQPAVRQLQRTFAWHHPYLFVIIPFGVLVYVIVAIIVSRKMKLRVGVCAGHLAACRTWLALSVVLFAAVAGVIVAFAAGAMKELIAWACGILAFAGAVAAELKSRWALLRPLRIGDDQGEFTGAGEQVLSRFPSNWEMYRYD